MSYSVVNKDQDALPLVNLICFFIYFRKSDAQMGGPPVNAKYILVARFEVDGVVEKSDIIGALFGQTEGLLGDELELRELQKIGKVGRIDVEYEIKGGKTVGTIIVPTNLDKPEVALIAAAIETVDKVGPNSSKIEIKEIRDAREEKRARILERAKEILAKWRESKNVESSDLIKALTEAVKVSQIISYGPDKLPAGPDIDDAQEIIIVEGRADVVNLLKHGYRNVIALDGSKIPPTIVNLSKNKKTIAFLDGDRAGDLILKELINVAKIDYIARAPYGKEVEQLSGKEIAAALSDKRPLSEYLTGLKQEQKIPKIQQVSELVKSLVGTMEALILDADYKIIERIPLKDVIDKISQIESFNALMIDGIITQRLIDLCKEKKVSAIYGYKIGNVTNIPQEISIYLFDEQGTIKKYEVNPQ